MNQLLMAYSIRLKTFLFSIWIWFVFPAQAQNTTQIKPFSDGVSEDILYETEMRYKDFSFTGLFAVKSEADGYHIYLISKTGFTLVEAILKENETVWIKTVSFLDKEHRKQKLDADFRLLTQSPLKFGSIKRKNKRGLKIKLNNGDRAFFNLENGVVTSVKIKGFLRLIKTKIEFKSISSKGLPQSIIATKTLIDAEIILKLHENK